MTDFRTAAQQALEALKLIDESMPFPVAKHAQAALRSALAQQEQEQEPVAWLYTGIKQDGTEHGPHLVWKPEYMDAMSASKGAKATPLYTAPPRQAEPLTIERLRDALVASRIIQPAAVEDPDGYDDGLTWFRIEALHRRLT